MSQSNGRDTPHRRRNLLTGDWIVVSPHRTLRPWQGHADKPSRAKRSSHLWVKVPTALPSSARKDRFRPRHRHVPPTRFTT